MTSDQAVETLNNNLDALNPQDRIFAASLLQQLNKRGSLSAKQWPWIEKLATKATTQEKPRDLFEVGNLEGILALFAKAKTHLKHPAIVLCVADEAKRLEYESGSICKEAFLAACQEIKINVAGERARAPGTLNVKRNEVEGDWYGRILKDGNFEASPRTQTPAPLIPALRKFAANPAAAAGEHGWLTGKCCFCNRTLTDERSTAVGYGSTCASHYDLPWGPKNHLYPEVAKAA